MTKIVALAFVFFSVPGYAPWAVIGGLLLLAALCEAAVQRRQAVQAPRAAEAGAALV